MIERNTRLFVSLLVLLAAAAPASPQTAPSGSSTSRVATGKNGKSGNSRSSPANGATPGPSSRLCFEPGAGWQSTLTAQPGEPATRGTNASLGANPQSAYPRVSGAKHSAECGGKLTEDQMLGVGIDAKSTILSPAVRPAGSTTKPGPVTALRVNSPYHLNGSGGPGPGRSTAVPSAPASAVSEGGPDAPSDLLGVRAFHAYTSPIKLRKLIRNASDFRTRIRLQQLQDNPANQLHRARVDTKTGQAARRPLKAERMRRSSSPGAATHGGPRDNSRTLLSAAPR
jgi:hypothetical protein